MLKLVLYSYMNHYYSTRKIESACRGNRTIVLDQLDEGKTYIFTHPDLTTTLVLEQTSTVILNKPVVD